MSYATQTDILNLISEKELVSLTDDTQSGVVDATKVSKAIADADAEIEGYCAKRYTVPFNPVPGIIAKLSVDIAIYNLYSRRSVMPDIRQKKYDDAVRLLRDIAKGVANLDQVPEPAENPGLRGMTSADTRIFSRDSLKGM